MNYLISGATGYIGSFLTKKLAKQGHHIHALTHITQPTFFHKNIQYIQTDITEKKNLVHLTDTYDAVFHCAAKVNDYGPLKQFVAINIQATKNLAETINTNCFVYLGHISYEKHQNVGYYSQTKHQAEHFLLQKHNNENYPVIIIRPGNVFGPNASLWVLRLIQSIQNNTIRLINNGKGIFHHTYIDNLLDAILLAINNPNAKGQTFDITDGDDSVTWKKYLDDLAQIINKPPIQKNISKTTAATLSKIMMIYSYLTKKPPLLSPTAVSILTNTSKISIQKAQTILGYKPQISYETSMQNIKQWYNQQKK
jgi:nucleoside-diphosphate-sugar epimerase